MIPFALLLLQTTANYRVILEGGAEGTARITQTKRAEGGKVVRMLASLKRAGAAIEIRTDSSFDTLGNPLRKVQNYGPPGKAPLHETIVTFDASGAHAVIRDRGVPRTSNVPLGAKLSRTNAAETWFSLTKPKPGDVAKCWTFDSEALEWVPTETTYVGPTKDGHLLRIVRREKRSEAVLDDAGLPVRIEEGGMKLERQVAPDGLGQR